MQEGILYSVLRIAEAHNQIHLSQLYLIQTFDRSIGRADVTVRQSTVPPISAPAASSTLADTACHRMNFPWPSVSSHALRLRLHLHTIEVFQVE